MILVYILYIYIYNRERERGRERERSKNTGKSTAVGDCQFFAYVIIRPSHT